MAHLYEQAYETGSKSEDAGAAIDFLKKAYALDPSSQLIGEQLAELYASSQRVREAMNEAQQVLQRDPNNVAIRRLLAKIYLRLLGDASNVDESGTMVMAIEQLREVVRLDPADTDSGIWLARLERLNNQNAEAEQVLRGVLAHDPNEESAAEQLAQLLLDQDKAEEAWSRFCRGRVGAGVPSGGLYNELGDALSRTHNLSQAEQAYRQAVTLEPVQASYLKALGECLFEEEKYQDAVEPYQKLLELQGEDVDNYLKLAEIYTHLHQLDKAEQQVVLAKQHAPGNLQVLYNEATIYQAEGRTQDALKVLSDAVAMVLGQKQVSPARRRTLAILYQMIGQIQRDTANYPAAIGTFQELGKLGPEEDVRARVMIINTYKDARDLPSAFAEASKAVAAYPNDREIKVSQALLYGENNQPDEAAAALRPLLSASAADVDVYVDLAEVYSETRRFADAEEAIRSAGKVVSLPADRETLGLLLGGVYERQKKYDQAEQAFQGVLAINPRNGPVLNYYGYMLADRGLRLDEAVSLVQRALAEDPANGAYLDSMGWRHTSSRTNWQTRNRISAKPWLMSRTIRTCSATLAMCWPRAAVRTWPRCSGKRRWRSGTAPCRRNWSPIRWLLSSKKSPT